MRTKLIKNAKYACSMMFSYSILFIVAIFETNTGWTEEERPCHFFISIQNDTSHLTSRRTTWGLLSSKLGIFTYSYSFVFAIEE